MILEVPEVLPFLAPELEGVIWVTGSDGESGIFSSCGGGLDGWISCCLTDVGWELVPFTPAFCLISFTPASTLIRPLIESTLEASSDWLICSFPFPLCTSLSSNILIPVWSYQERDPPLCYLLLVESFWWKLGEAFVSCDAIVSKHCPQSKTCKGPKNCESRRRPWGERQEPFCGEI